MTLYTFQLQKLIIQAISVTKFRLNHTLLFMLIMAFLTMQWSVAHIHLAEHHNHDGGHHQHQIETHAHHSLDHHPDSIDSSHQNADLNVVELDHQYNSSTGKNKTPTTAAITANFWQSSFSRSVSIELPVIINTKLGFHERSTVYLRAPPQLS